jgi:hypothetical protein
MQLIGRPCHVAGVYDADEVFQLPKIQNVPLEGKLSKAKGLVAAALAMDDA